jgi:hypothetical protein
MRIYQGDVWGIETAGWSIDQDATCVTLCPADVHAALQLSAYRKRSGDVSEEELSRTLREKAPEGIRLRKVSCGAFSGYTCEYVDEERTFWRMWDLCHGRTELFVTFNCAERHRDGHRVVVDWMLASLEAGRA